METQKIGDVGNYYGGLHVMVHDGSYYWMIENYNTDFDNINHWSQIDKELYDALVAFQKRFNGEQRKTNHK